jgi:predicted nucleic acid-binding protein
MILVDTSTWIDHFRRSRPALVAALEDGQVGLHPFVFGELTLGHLPRRLDTLGASHGGRSGRRCGAVRCR